MNSPGFDEGTTNRPCFRPGMPPPTTPYRELSPAPVFPRGRALSVGLQPPNASLIWLTKPSHRPPSCEFRPSGPSVPFGVDSTNFHRSVVAGSLRNSSRRLPSRRTKSRKKQRIGVANHSRARADFKAGQRVLIGGKITLVTGGVYDKSTSAH